MNVNMEKVLTQIIKLEKAYGSHSTATQFEILLTELSSLNEEQVATQIFFIYGEHSALTMERGKTIGRAEGMRGVTK